MTSTTQPFKPITTRFKARQKQYTHKQNMKTLTQLLKTPNITIKKSLLGHVKIIDIAKLKRNEFTPVSEMVESTENYGKRNLTKKGKQVKKKTQPKPAEAPKEYYPSFPKRKVEPKEIKLMPKHNYKIVGTTNKRKRGIPHYYTEIKSLPPIQNSTEHRKSATIEELVRLADNDLTDEDFLEILTCPSPVWWEDNEEYSSEEELNQNMEENYREILHDFNSHSQTVNIGIEITKKVSAASNNKTNNVFKGKRSKLENILGNIIHKKFKNAETNDVFDDSHKNADRNVNSDITNRDSYKNNNSDQLNEHSDTNGNPDTRLNCDTGRNSDISGNSDTRRNSHVSDNSDTCGNSDKVVKKRNSSLSGLSDTSIDEDLLKTLENIEIPVQNHCEDENNQNNDKENSKKLEKISSTVDDVKNENNCVLVMEKIEQNAGGVDKNNKIKTNNTKVRITQDKSNLTPTRKSNRKSPIKRKYYQDFEVFYENKRQRKTIKNERKTIKAEKGKSKTKKIKRKEINNKIPNLVPTVLPTLKKYPGKKTIAKESKSEDNPSVVVDSISDKNIKFLDEFQESVNINNLVTIYKILPTEPEQIDVEDQIIANLLNKDRFKEQEPTNEQELNNYTNKNNKIKYPKPTQRKSDHNVAILKNTQKKVKKAQNVATKNHKYCYNCSSIFYTDTCQYCIFHKKSRKSNKSIN